MKRLEGKVAFVTGAARGQGRSHCVRLAEEGASIIAMDICKQIPTVFYALSTEEDLNETVRLVKEAGGEIVVSIGDVSKRDDVQRAYDAGIEQFGHVDIVIPNAGIMPVINEGSQQQQAWYDTIGTLLTGVWNVLDVTVPGMVERGEGGSISITSSSAGNTSIGLDISPGGAAYSAAKHGVVGLMRRYSRHLASHMIRVNTIHPTGVNTPMITNPEYMEFVNAHPEVANDPAYQNPMPVPWVEPVDISNAIVFLASDEARYITGIQMPVDAGYQNS